VNAWRDIAALIEKGKIVEDLVGKTSMAKNTSIKLSIGTTMRLTRLE
jgi:hypothetical protein